LANNVEKLEGDDQRFVLSFLSKIDLAQNVKSVDKASEDIIKTIGRLRGLSAEENPVDKKGRPISLEGSIADLQLQVDKSRGQIQLMTGRTGSVLSKQEAQRLGPHIRRYERSLNRIEKTISDPTRIRGDGLFVRRLSAVTSDLAGQGSGGRYNSIERAYLRSLGDEFTRGSASGIAGDDRIEDLIRGVDENGYQYIRRNRMVLPTLEKDRQFFAVDDFMDVLYKDTFYSKFLWAAKINPRLKALTPDYYMKQFMVKMHYFGLVVDEESIVGPNGELIKPKFFLFKWANKMIDKSQKKGGAFANKFSIEIKGFGNHIVKGGNRFGAVQNLSKLIKSESFNAGKMAALMGADGIMGMKGTLARLNLPFDDLSVEKLLKIPSVG